MALPKEPRQKMINLMYLVLTALLALNVSSEILNAFKVVNNSLDKSNNSLSISSSDVYNSLEAALRKEETREKALLIKPKADSLRAYSAAVDSYINELKMKILSESDYDSSSKTFKEDDLEAAIRLMDTKGEGKKLYKNLKQYVDDIINLMGPNYMKKAFPTGLPIILDNAKNDNEWTIKYFNMVPSIAALTILSKFQNDVKNTESQAAKFLLSEIGAVEIVYDQFTPLISQSSNYVMPGQEITIRAGIGAFSSASAPQVTINGQTFNAVNGYGETKVIASGPGVHKIPVKISFRDQNGKVQTLDKEVEYTVGTPSGAAVMLDKMNVFYVGVDNPVTIGSPVGWDKTSVSMSGGSISGSGSNRTVKVGAVGNASITVTADGKSSTFNFRCKRIPNPIFKVGDGRVRMPSVAFKSQAYCRAELENFDFDLRYNVVGATVYFSGANFSSVATASIGGNSLAPLSALMAKCGPGTVVTFDNIRVSGPDGTRAIDSKSIALY